MLTFLLYRGHKKMSKPIKKQDCSEMRDNDGLRFMPEALNLFFRDSQSLGHFILPEGVCIIYKRGILTVAGIIYHSPEGF